MTTYISSYWWGSSLDNHKIHWLKWSKFTDPKEDGGMGFRDMSLFNKAMLGKQGWRLLIRLEALCSRVLKGKHFPNSNFLAATRRKKSSETWRAILHGRDVLKRGIIKQIGPGSSVNIWEDNWIPGTMSMKPLVRLPGMSVTPVEDLFVPGTRRWNEQLIGAQSSG
jgi:hypothetical protein